MADVSAKLVKELRDKTGAGMMDCKKALAETNAVLEARKLDIPLVSMLDTNCDPDLCEVPIPCNDDAVRSVQLVLGRLADAINEGRHGNNDQRGGDDRGD